MVLRKNSQTKKLRLKKFEILSSLYRKNESQEQILFAGDTSVRSIN
ncbi:hypothetical protein T08_4567 [Trichinella sp. T8]|nr:hypothetical protein T08_4567 [Trichinella sp. T8]